MGFSWVIGSKLIQNHSYAECGSICHLWAWDQLDIHSEFHVRQGYKTKQKQSHIATKIKHISKRSLRKNSTKPKLPIIEPQNCADRDLGVTQTWRTCLLLMNLWVTSLGPFTHLPAGLETGWSWAAWSLQMVPLHVCLLLSKGEHVQFSPILTSTSSGLRLSLVLQLVLFWR